MFESGLSGARPLAARGKRASGSLQQLRRTASQRATAACAALPDASALAGKASPGGTPALDLFRRRGEAGDGVVPASSPCESFVSVGVCYLRGEFTSPAAHEKGPSRTRGSGFFLSGGWASALEIEFQSKLNIPLAAIEADLSKRGVESLIVGI